VLTKKQIASVAVGKTADGQAVLLGTVLASVLVKAKAIGANPVETVWDRKREPDQKALYRTAPKGGVNAQGVAIKAGDPIAIGDKLPRTQRGLVGLSALVGAVAQAIGAVKPEESSKGLTGEAKTAAKASWAAYNKAVNEALGLFGLSARQDWASHQQVVYAVGYEPKSNSGKSMEDIIGELMA
jgi:hypothetical protein